MALPASGAISLSAVNTELALSSTAQITMNDAAVRSLFGVASGAITMNNGYGKSNRTPLSVTYSTNTTDASLNIAALGGYVSGKTDVTVTVNSGIYVYGSSTGTPGLTISGGAAGDTVTLVNNGYILGRGGAGGNGGPGSPANGDPGSAGGTALSVSRAVSITNNGTIAGGGGGGGGGGRNAGDWYGGCGGGGGAPLGAGGSRGAWSGAGTGGATNGSTATLTSAGAGGPTINVSAAGGAGGAYGTSGSAGNNSSQRTGGSAGGAGNYISGNSNVTWLTNGTRTGGVA